MLLGLTLLELAFFSVFAILLVVGAALDRNEKSEGFKWWVLVIGGIIIAAHAFPYGEFSFGTWISNITSTLLSASFWQPFGIFLVAGVVYSIVEFIVGVRRSEKYFSVTWQSFLDSNRGGNMTINGQKEPSKSVREMLGNELYNEEVKNRVTEYASCYKRGFIRLHVDKNSAVTPAVDKRILSSYMGAWIIFWPAYAINLILGDLVQEICDVLSEFFANLGGRFVRMTFSSTFKA